MLTHYYYYKNSLLTLAYILFHKRLSCCEPTVSHGALAVIRHVCIIHYTTVNS